MSRAIAFASFACAALALLVVQCSSPTASPSESAGDSTAADAWRVIYRVLQHPRCMNCHPAGDAPLQGDDRLPHAQNAKRGRDGEGVFAMRCENCHMAQNSPGAHMPPGAPRWHLSRSDMPLVFEGRSARELCLQLKDPAQNGGMTPERLFHHMAEDPLVLWGWDPGEGRAPVPTPHEELVRAVRAWVDGGCGCPER